MPLWYPSVITTWAWFDASDSASVTLISGKVSQWSDKSSNNRHATQGTAGNRPIVSAASVNSLDSLEFDGTDDWLEFAELGDSSSAQVSIFAVVSMDTATTNGAIVSTRPPALGEGFSLRCNSNTEVAYFHPGYSSSATSSALTPSGVNIVGVLRNGLSSNLVVNGTLDDTATHPGFAASSLNKTIMGGENGGSGSLFNGKICEIVIISSVVSSSLRENIEGYLAWKWGLEANLPSDHRYKDAAPELPIELLATLEQPYGDVPVITSALSQPYSLLLLSSLIQKYGDVTTLKTALDQYFDSSRQLTSVSDQVYEDALQIVSSLSADYSIVENVTKTLAQIHSLLKGNVGRAFASLYDIKDNEKVSKHLPQVYSIDNPDIHVDDTVSLYINGVD